ncbi:MAG: autotransporter outer membrane beta-barrel domain-containing protein, partial [Verrucomicrobiota bacterium]
GTISGQFVGLSFGQSLEGTIFNCGIIEGTNLDGIRLFEVDGGVVINDGGRIQGVDFSVNFGLGDGTLVLSGPSHLVGTIGGGAGSDVIRFENMRGINAAKQAELAALAAADPVAGTVTLFGETIEWENIQDIQADLTTLVSYESLLTGPGLSDYARALDNVQGLTDSFRALLKELNNADLNLLNDGASNSSGQTLHMGLDDFVRNQDTRLYSLLSNEFASLRPRDSASDRTAAGRSSGLFSREVPISATVGDSSDGTEPFLTGYVEQGNQSATGSRPDSSYDNTTILFGSGKKVTSDIYLGVFGGYTDNESRVDGFGSLLKNEAGYFGMTAQYEGDFLFANLVAAYGFHDQMSRRRDIAGNVMEGDAIGHQGILYTQVGREYRLATESNIAITPYAGFALSSLSMGGYTESGPVGTALRFESETMTSFQTVLGVTASCFKETSRGWVKPRFDVAWWHEFDESDQFGVAFANPGQLNALTISGVAANRDRGVFQAGVEFGFDRWEALTFDAGYFGTIGGEKFSAHGGSISANLEF